MIDSPGFQVSGDRHIFLSYRSNEVEFALRLAADLKNAGVKLWMDRLDIYPGDDWRSSLQYGVHNSVAVVALLSPDYVSSKYCLRELAMADRLDKAIFPVLLHPLDDTQWPIEIERRQYVDFSNWHDAVHYRQQLARLVDVLKERFTEQYIGEPALEFQMMTNLAAELETQRGLTEYLELASDADKWFSHEYVRPEPRHSKNWTGPTSFILYPESAHEFVPPAFPRKRLQDIDRIMAEMPAFVLIGEPGAGKTSILSHLALKSIYAYQADPETAPYPLLLNLVGWDDLADFQTFIRQHWRLPNDPIEMIEAGQVILFLDGLNEIQGARLEKIQRVRRWLNSSSPPRRIVVTCRSADYGPETNLGLPCVQIGKMDADHICEFAVNYLGEEIAPFLVNQIIPAEPWADQYKHYLYEQARNPFYLGAMILAHKSSVYGDVPENLGGLLQRLVIEMWQRENLPAGIAARGL